MLIEHCVVSRLYFNLIHLKISNKGYRAPNETIPRAVIPIQTCLPPWIVPTPLGRAPDQCRSLERSRRPSTHRFWIPIPFPSSLAPSEWCLQRFHLLLILHLAYYSCAQPISVHAMRSKLERCRWALHPRALNRSLRLSPLQPINSNMCTITGTSSVLR